MGNEVKWDWEHLSRISVALAAMSVFTFVVGVITWFALRKVWQLVMCGVLCMGVLKIWELNKEYAVITEERISSTAVWATNHYNHILYKIELPSRIPLKSKRGTPTAHPSEDNTPTLPASTTTIGAIASECKTWLQSLY